MSVIDVRGLVKRFGRVRALDGLSFSVPPGAVFGFLGPNGAGKTTTLRIMVGLARPDAGTVFLSGQGSGRAGDPRREIGYLPEDLAFYSWMTGLEHLVFAGSLHGLSRKEATARAWELLELAGLRGAARRRVGTYSRGMRQRLGIALCLVNRPRILILDEPASALDPIGRADVLALIRQMRGRATVLMSTHILADVERVCDRVAIIDRGRLVLESGLPELRERYVPHSLTVEVAGDMSTLADSVRARPWARGVQVDGETMRVECADIGAAQAELPGEIARAGARLLSFRTEEPTLEGIFVRLVDQGRGLTDNAGAAPAQGDA